MEKNNITIEKATIKDSKDILDIIEEKSFPGNIELLFTRRPDPISCYFNENKNSFIIVAKDIEQKVLAFSVCSIYNRFINGKIQKIAYLHSLKIKKEYQKKFKIMLYGYDYIKKELKKRKVEYIISTVLSENIEVLSMFNKPRKSIPHYQKITDLRLFSIIKKIKEGNYKNLVIESGNLKNIKDIINYINNKNKIHDLSMEIVFKKLLNNEYTYGIQNFVAIYENNKIIGSALIINKSKVKQYIVKNYNGKLKLLYFLLKWLPKSLITKLPRIGEELRFNFIDCLFLENYNYLPNLINFILSNQKNVQFHSIGTVSGSELYNRLNKCNLISYDSVLYNVDFFNNMEKYKNIKLDFSIL